VNEPMNRETAWKLVKAVPSGLAGDTERRSISLPGPEGELVVYPTGRWKASGAVSDEAADLLDLYLPLQVRAEFTVAQMGQSLDGRIATESGDSHYVTGPEDITRLHRLRALADAVVVGAGTALADDPRLTVRRAEGPNPVRVVLDPRGRVPWDRRLFRGEEGTALAIHGEGIRSHPPAGVDVVNLPTGGDRGFDPAAVLAVLHGRGLRRVLVEGGGITVSRFLQAGLLHRLHITVAPLIIGSGRQGLTLEPIESLKEGLRPHCRHFRLGSDILFDLEFRPDPTP
jgi:diaminohydroxyphosphoribosylaminopyrimidine deaminase / 5-amino-6-(5-phosphoribosylamino)uracil reductase